MGWKEGGEEGKWTCVCGTGDKGGSGGIGKGTGVLQGIMIWNL